MRFIDCINFHVASGTGGNGCSSFRREKHVPMGGPDGGDGGRGGSLIFEATTSRNTLVDYKVNKTYKAEDGRPGMGRQMTGADGEDLTLLVPVGTVITNYETGDPLAGLKRPRGAQGQQPFQHGSPARLIPPAGG